VSLPSAATIAGTRGVYDHSNGKPRYQNGSHERSGKCSRMKRASEMYAASMLARYRVSSPSKRGRTSHACSAKSARAIARSGSARRVAATGGP
jgi:hypothetical protein